MKIFEKNIPLISVITPTWNRAKYLHRVYNSLISQEYSNFEWIVCDDFSDDNTIEILTKFKLENKIKIKIYSFPARVGKNKMDNFGIKMAKGKFIYIADSDDLFKKNFFKDMIEEWQKIPKEIEKKIFAIISPCYYKKKSLKFCVPYKNISSIKLWYHLKKNQESALFIKASVIKKYKFKEIDYYTPEGVLWDEISLKYNLWVVDKYYRIYLNDAKNSITNSNKINYIFGQRYALFHTLIFLYKIKLLNLKNIFFLNINLNRFNLHSDYKFTKQLHDLNYLYLKFFLCTTFFFGSLLYFKDRIQKKIIKNNYKLLKKIKPKFI